MGEGTCEVRMCFTHVRGSMSWACSQALPLGRLDNPFLGIPMSDFRIMLEFNREMRFHLQKLILQLTLLGALRAGDFQAPSFSVRDSSYVTLAK